MIQANSTSFAAYGADSADSPVSSDFLARYTTDRSRTDFIHLNDALSRYTPSAVDPVLSIPVRGNFVPTHLQWRCASEPAEDDGGEAGAVGDAAKIITNVDNQAALASARVCSPDTNGREGVVATLTRLLDESCAAPESGAVGEAADVFTNVDNPVGSSGGRASSCDTSLEGVVHLRDENRVASVGAAEELIAVANGPAGLPRDSYRFHDAGLEVLVSRYQETAAALEQALWQRLDEEQRLLQSATGQFSQEDTRDPIPLLEIGRSSLTVLRCRLWQIDDDIVQNCALVERLSSRQTRQVQAHAHSPVETRQAEAVPPAADPEPEELCHHYHRRCCVRFSCCSEFFSCHRCHNDSDKCDNTAARASHATHLKCAECQVVQEINEDSHHCANCRIEFAEYFCARCKHFSGVERKPFHCEKCGICRFNKDKAFHCDVCNVCLDKRIEGKHKCRPDSGHDECCVCLEDTFSGCQVLPCSHKVHELCGKALMQNGIINCPICRHPIS